VASLTRDQAANAMRLFEAQDLTSRNLLSSGFGGPGPSAAEDGHRMYLSWHAEVERFLREAHGEPPEFDALDTRRHRDLVNGVVDPQQMHREVQSEIERVRLALRPVVERLELLMRETAPDSSVPKPAMRRFSSDQGREYRYDPADSLGQGSALTQVFRGEDDEGRAVAVKQVRIRLDTSGRRRAEPRLAEREVEIARQLRDAQGAHLIPVLDYAHLDGELLLVMPLAEYSLADRISDAGQLSSGEVRAMLLDVAQGMQELVAAGVLHRDIKPHNILWYRGHWCLADFGTSRILDAAAASVSWVGSGTAEYRAPELLDGKPETQLSDAYALGLSALEALTGNRIISGSDLRQAHASLVPVFPEGTDPLVRRAIAELLHKDPGGRPSDARRITELLQPAGTLSDAQRGLQSLRARQAERDLELSALVAQAQEHSGLQRQARASFKALWRRISDSATQAVLDATSTQDGDVFALTVGDAELRAHLSGVPAPAGALLMVAELYIDRAGQSRIVGNLYCTGDGGLPQWRLVQLKNKGTSELTGYRAETFSNVWNLGSDLPPQLEAMSTEADAEAVLTLFASEAAEARSDRPGDHADEVQTKLDELDAAEAQDEDRIIAALGEEISFMTVAGVMTVANTLRALAEGEVTIRARLEPRIDIAFSWHDHTGDGRFSEPGGTLLTVRAHVDADLGGGTPVIQTTWNPADTPEAVIGRINSQLIERDRWNGSKTIDWGQVFRDLRTAIQLAVAYKRRDPDAPWRLHGAMYEIHGTDWAITEAGVEYRPTGTVVLAEHEFPENRARMTSTDLNDWSPAPPEGADATEWQHVLWRGLWHLPIQHGPVVSQPTWWPSKTMPQQPTAKD
jgi:serine/threonine protein kinase